MSGPTDPVSGRSLNIRDVSAVQRNRSLVRKLWGGSRGNGVEAQRWYWRHRVARIQNLLARRSWFRSTSSSLHTSHSVELGRFLLVEMET